MNLFNKGKGGAAPAPQPPAFNPIDRGGLLGLLDQIVNGNQSGVLELQEPRGNWVYAFQAGALTHASGGRVRGARQAFDLLWEFQAGQFRFTPGQNVALAGNLYIDKGRLLDLLRRSTAVLQGPSAPYIPPDQVRPIAPVQRPYTPPSPAQMPPAWQPGMQQPQAPGWPPAYPQQAAPPAYPQQAAPPAYPQQAAPQAPAGYPGAPAQPPYAGAPGLPFPGAQPYPAPAQPYPGAPAQPYPGGPAQQFPQPFPAAPATTPPSQPVPPQGYPPVRGNVRPQVAPQSAPPYPPAYPQPGAAIPQTPAAPLQPQMPAFQQAPAQMPPQAFPQAPAFAVQPPAAPAGPARASTPPSFSVPPMPIPKKSQAMPAYVPQAQPEAAVPPAEPPKTGPKDDLAALRASLVAQAPVIKPAPSASWGVRQADGTVALPAPAPADGKGKGGKTKTGKKKGDSKLMAAIKLQLIKFLLWACERRYSPDDHWTLKDAFEVSTMELRDQFLGAFSQTLASAKKTSRPDDDDMDDMAAGRMRGRARRH